MSRLNLAFVKRLKVFLNASSKDSVGARFVSLKMLLTL